MATIREVFKAAYVYEKTRIRPTCKKSEFNNGLILFEFPDIPEIEAAIASFFKNENGIRDYVEFYKNLRCEMYLVRGEKNEEG